MSKKSCTWGKKMKGKSQCFFHTLINLVAFDLAAQSGSRLRKMSQFLQRAKVVPACITFAFPFCLLQQHLFSARPTLCFCSKAQQHSYHSGKLLMHSFWFSSLFFFFWHFKKHFILFKKNFFWTSNYIMSVHSWVHADQHCEWSFMLLLLLLSSTPSFFFMFNVTTIDTIIFLIGSHCRGWMQSSGCCHYVWFYK